MICLKIIRSRHFNNAPLNSSNFIYLSSISRRSFSRPAESAHNADKKVRSFTEPLSGFFRRVLFGVDKTNRVVPENAEKLADDSLDKLRNLEEQVRHLNKEKCEPAKRLQSLSEKNDSAVAPKMEKKRSLSELFANGNKGQSKLTNAKSKSVSKPALESKSVSELMVDEKKGQLKSKPNSKSKSVSKAKSASASEVISVDRSVYGMENPMVYRELTSDMKMFAEHLYVKGYLKNATFMPQNRFDSTLFEVSYAREFLKFSSIKFGEDHPDIARWLSAGDLKKIALFGCPTVGQRTVFAAKHMRKFFKIDEHKVCQACTLKDMCKHPNKISKDQSTNLHLPSVMKVLIMYAMELVPKQLVVPEEVKNSVSRLLKEIVSLSQVNS